MESKEFDKNEESVRVMRNGKKELQISIKRNFKERIE